MRSDLFGENLEQQADGLVVLQNKRMLKVRLQGDVLARQGSMVAYQGRVDFDFEGSGVARFLKKAVTGEGMPIMRCSGEGDLFLAHDAREVYLLWLDGDSVTVSGGNVLAFAPSLDWDIRRVQGAAMLAGGLFNTVFSGTGWIALTAYGTPVVLQTDAPTFADAQAAIAWSTTLRTTLHRSVKAKALIGRGSGELAQLGFEGSGFVIVQASEGPPAAPNPTSRGGGLGNLLGG